MILLLLHSRSSFCRSSFLFIGLIKVVKRVTKLEKSPLTAKESKPGPKTKTKAEFAESKKKNLTDSQTRNPLNKFTYCSRAYFSWVFHFSRTLKFNKENERDFHTITAFEFPRTTNIVPLVVNGRDAIISLAGGISC